MVRDDHDPSDWRDLNLAWWEERAPLHETSSFYRSGGGGLKAFEWDDLGSVEGLDVVHPQCHIGTDTLALAERGARVVGLDFSANAIAAAGRLAATAGLADRSNGSRPTSTTAWRPWAAAPSTSSTPARGPCAGCPTWTAGPR